MDETKAIDRAVRRNQIVNALVKDLTDNPEFAPGYARKTCNRCYGRGKIEWSHPQQWGFQMVKEEDKEVPHFDPVTKLVSTEVVPGEVKRMPVVQKQFCQCVYNYIDRTADEQLKIEEEEKMEAVA